MASFGRSMEKLASAIASCAEGINQRLDENHLVDMLVELNDEDISISKFTEFTETMQALRSGKKVNSTSTKSTTTVTNS